MVDKEELREALAALEHEQWSSWAQKLLEKEPLSMARQRRWKQLLVPYNELSEFYKEFDREWADKTINLLEDKGLL